MIHNKKEFENPDDGVFLGVIADVLLYRDIPSKYDPNKKINKLMVIWLLNAKDSDGNYFRVTKTIYDPYIVKTKKGASKMWQLIEDVFGEAPSATFDDESFIGRSNNLLIARKKTDQGTFANVMSISPLKSGQQPMAIPADFVRNKDKSNAIGATATYNSNSTVPRAQLQPETNSSF
jgi:hypothetical protein